MTKESSYYLSIQAWHTVDGAALFVCLGGCAISTRSHADRHSPAWPRETVPCLTSLCLQNTVFNMTMRYWSVFAVSIFLFLTVESASVDLPTFLGLPTPKPLYRCYGTRSGIASDASTENTVEGEARRPKYVHTKTSNTYTTRYKAAKHPLSKHLRCKRKVHHYSPRSQTCPKCY